MKVPFIASLVALIGIVSFPLATSAATVTLQNYFYAHANTAGTFPFKDKYGAAVQWGDAVEHDASILSFVVEAQGMAANDQIIAYSSGGSQWSVTPGQITEVTISESQTLRIDLIKSGTNEVFARLSDLLAFDQDDGGTNVSYVYSVNDMPSAYGDLGNGSSNPAIVNGNYYYFAERDNYKYDYTKPTGATRYELHYLYPDGTTQYKRDYEQAPTGTHYLTCNGTYIMRFFDGSGIIAESPEMVTTEIVNPTCASTAGDGGYQDFTATKQKNADGSVDITWEPVPGATKYDIYKDGQKVGETTETTYHGDTDGNYSVVGKDASSNIVGQADLTPETTTGGESECGDVCQKIRDAMACPEWDEYMGEWTNAIKNALPPPPDWPSIADIFVGKFADYFGNVPAVPSKPDIANQITPPLPPLDTSVPDASMTPDVPSEFDNPIGFDITTGQVIPVVDESEPIEIYEPDKYIDSDDPGDMVYPGDDRNHSDGIKEPDRIDTGYTQPTPTISVEDYDTPPTDIPIPSGNGSTTPIPNNSGGTIPIPGGG